MFTSFYSVVNAILQTNKKYKNLSINKKTFLRCIDKLPKTLNCDKDKKLYKYINIDIDLSEL